MTTYRMEFKVDDRSALSAIEVKCFKIFDYMKEELPEAEGLKVEALNDDNEMVVTVEGEG